MDDDAVRLIGHLPVGKGLLGVPVDENAALRLDDLTSPSGGGRVPRAPPADESLRGRADHDPGCGVRNVCTSPTTHPSEQFSEADEVAVRALASAAATAIDNAQLFERVQMSARWTDASREITAALLGGSRTSRAGHAAHC